MDKLDKLGGGGFMQTKHLCVLIDIFPHAPVY